MIDLKGNPFFLSDEDIQWVEKTLKGMSLKQKVGQLFCPIGETFDRQQLKEMIDQYQSCGIMYRTEPSE